MASALVALLSLAASCGSEDGQGGSGGKAAAGGHAAGSGGAGGDVGGEGGAGGMWTGTGGIEAPCLDIWVDTDILDEPLASGIGPVAWPRQPFWRNQDGLHVIWPHSEKTGDFWQPVHLLVSTFDPSTGVALAHRIYDPWPPEVKMGGMSVFGTAGAPDGSFAAAIGYGDDGSPDGYAVKLVFGRLDQEGTLTEWVSPYSIVQWHPFHLGWDGEAYAIAFRAQSPDVLIMRFSADGNEVLGPTQVGSIATIYEDRSSFYTDPETGTTWLASDAQDGVWLSGHLRDGSPLPGMAADGYMLVKGQGVPPTWVSSWNTAMAFDGARVLLAWTTNSFSTTYLQQVEGGTEQGDAFVLFDNPEGTGPYLSKKHLARVDGGWWLTGSYGPGAVPEMGMQSFWLGDTPDGLELTGRTVLVGFPPCWPGCENEFDLALHYRAALRYQSELWCGFEDGTANNIGNGYPYRIVRVGRTCRYPTHFEILNPDP